MLALAMSAMGTRLLSYMLFNIWLISDVRVRPNTPTATVIKAPINAKPIRRTLTRVFSRKFMATAFAVKNGSHVGAKPLVIKNNKRR